MKIKLLILVLGIILLSGLNVNAAIFTFTHDLTLRASGEDVSALQQFLITSKFLKISMPTGYFGQLTRSALGAWQSSVGISPSVGFFGPISRGKMNVVTQIKTTTQPPTVIGVQEIVGTAPTPVTSTGAATINTTNGLPVRLTIPKLGVDAGFQDNGLKSDGTMEIPTNITDVGWFTGSVHPGERGVAIVTGHVAQIRGGVVTKPGVFANLNTLRVGDKLSVINDKGQTNTFIVRESRNYDPTADAASVFTSTDSGVHLNLITCEGTWIPGQLSYSQRLVVFTDLVR